MSIQHWTPETIQLKLNPNWNSFPFSYLVIYDRILTSYFFFFFAVKILLLNENLFIDHWDIHESLFSMFMNESWKWFKTSSLTMKGTESSKLKPKSY